MHIISKYTQSGNVKRYEPLRMSYWAFYRIWPNELGADNSSLLAYRYICDPLEYFYSIDDQIYSISSVSSDSKLLSYTIDSNGICHYSINPGRLDHGLNGIEYGNTILGRFYNYYNYTGNEHWQVYPENIPTTLNGLTEGTDYICKKYSYGTEEYNELMSYLIGTSFNYSGTNGGTPDVTLKVKLSKGDDVESTGFNSFIKHFSNEKFMPDIFVVQNYAENYSPADVPSCNIWCYGVVQGYKSAPSDDWTTTITIIVESFGDNNVTGTGGAINPTDLNLSSSNPLFIFGGDDELMIDSIDLTNKRTTTTGLPNNTVNISLNTHQHSSFVNYMMSNVVMLKLRIEFGKGTVFLRDEHGDIIVENGAIYEPSPTFDPGNDMLGWLENQWGVNEDNPSGSPFFILAQYKNTELKPYIWNGLGYSQLGGVVIHDMYDSEETGATVEAYFMLGVQQINNKFYLADTIDIQNMLNSWVVYIKSTDETNTGAIPFQGCNFI